MIKKQIEFPDFVKLDVRVGVVETAEMVSGSDRLLRLEVNLGEEIGTRQIIAGLAEHYEATDLLDKQVVVIVNLKPRMMMGLESQGMLLAASSVPALLKPNKEVENGAIVS